MPRVLPLLLTLACLASLLSAQDPPYGIHERTEPLHRIDPNAPDTIPGFEVSTPMGVVRTLPSLHRIELQRSGETHPDLLGSDFQPRLPSGIAFTETHMFVADTGNRRILRWNIDGNSIDASSITILNTPRLRRPVGLATHNNRLFIADSWSDQILVVDANGQLVRTIAQHGSQPGFLSGPIGLLIHNDLIFVADSRNSRVQAFEPDTAEFVYEWGLHVIRPHEGEGRLHYPTKLILSEDATNIGVTEPWEDRVQWFRQATPDETVPKRLPLGADNFVHFGPGVDVFDRLLAVTDPDTHTVRIFDLQLETPVLIGVIGEFGDLPAQFAHPSSVAFLPEHDGRPLRLAVTDRGNARIALYAIDWSSAEPLRFRPTLASLIRTFDLSALDQQHPTDAAAILANPDETLTLLDAANSRSITLNHRLRQIDSDSLKLDQSTIPSHWISARRHTNDEALFLDRAKRCVLIVSGSGMTRTIPLDPNILEPVDLLYRREDILVVDRGRHCIVRCDLEGNALEYIGQPGLEAGMFHKPASIRQLPDNRVLIIDRGNHRIQIFNADWTLTIIDGPRLYTSPAKVGQSAPRSPVPPQSDRPKSN